MSPQVTTSFHQWEPWICSALRNAWLTSCLLFPKQPDSHNQGALPSLSNCVFLQRIISLKGPWERKKKGGSEESSVTDYEGAHSRVQKVGAPTPADLAVWENQHAQYVAIFLSVVISSAFSFSSLVLSQPNHHSHPLHDKLMLPD